MVSLINAIRLIFDNDLNHDYIFFLLIVSKNVALKPEKFLSNGSPINAMFVQEYYKKW